MAMGAPRKLPVLVGLLGPGLIGKALLTQLSEQAATLHSDFGVELQVYGIASSKRMVVSKDALEPQDWQQWDSLPQATAADLQAFGSSFVARDGWPSQQNAVRVIFDCTASGGPPSHYSRWMSEGIHVITPNKKLGSGPLVDYRAVRQVQHTSPVHFLYEATVGAGLPILSTLKGLVETGDRVQRIEGIFSGTLSFIFNNFGAGQPFSQVVKEAKAGGYTEPDPRDDLSGMDVGRKVTILARECGLDVELSDVDISSLVPEPLQSVSSADEFLERLPQYDGEMASRVEQAEASGQVLRYVGVIDVVKRRCSVGLQAYPKSHAFAQLSGTDNVVSFTTQRYSKQALIVRGPGAGADVTAAGVFTDLMQLLRYCGAPSASASSACDGA
ncbi:hypothetical protein WJX72_012566 [[Myrmecia] bisecta]|uniref:Homoserine dehydrogenase n=1 Tax=[Myrmecia] bisecta TaxID=41462 RepID=A0AAW1PDJ8_9CHLO